MTYFLVFRKRTTSEWCLIQTQRPKHVYAQLNHCEFIGSFESSIDAQNYINKAKGEL